LKEPYISIFQSLVDPQKKPIDSLFPQLSLSPPPPPLVLSLSLSSHASAHEELLDYRVLTEIAEMVALMGSKNPTEAEKQKLEEIKSMYESTKSELDTVKDLNFSRSLFSFCFEPKRNTYMHIYS